MARLSRVTSKLFAENATKVGQFGSLNAGTKVTTTDIATIQGLQAWGDGWQAAGLGQNCYPSLQERNGLDKVLSYFLNYLYQEGIPEWDSGTTYYTGSIVKLINGTNVQLYQSLVDNNTAALSDTTAWIAWDYADRTLSNLTSISNNAQTLLNAIYANKNIAVTHTTNTAAGTTSQPIYVTSSGVATACSGIDVTKLCCTTKPTTTSSASTTKPAVIKENYINDTSWYRVWSDGWIEQGGYADVSDMANSGITNANKKVTFAKQFTSAPPVVITQKGKHSSSSITYIGTSGWGNTQELVINVTKNYFCTQVHSTSGYNGCSWYACGY